VNRHLPHLRVQSQGKNHHGSEEESPNIELLPLQRVNGLLGWEFQFSVPISGTPIVSGIPISCLIPKIPVGFYF
jgi:hypothetical protein